MYPEYKEKIEHLYKYQVRIFRVYGVDRLSTETTKFKKIAYGLYSTLIFSWVAIYNLCLLIEFFNQPTILDKIVNVFFGLATFIAVFVKLFCLKKNSSLYQEPISFLFKDIFVPINSVEDTMLNRNIVMSKRVRNFYGLVSILALTYVLVIHKIAYPQELPVAAYTPFGINFVVMEVYSFTTITYMCHINIAYDSWCTSFLIFAKTQLEFLKDRLEAIGKNTQNNLAINRDLKKCIHHHAEVLRLVQIIENAISVPVSIQFFCSILVLCCNFYAMSFTSVKDDTSAFLTFFMYQMAMLFQIFFICYFSNDVTLTSLKLSHALYSSNWITWNRTNRKLMLLTMLRFQSPIRLRSINRCYSLDLTTFTTIVNTSYSYFALLKQMNN